MNGWSILYRGPLASCNFDCDYCPFAKTRDSRAALAEDARQLSRFVDWVGGRDETIGVLFTPWGEGLIRRHYQDAIVRLSRVDTCRRVAIQTNLSCPLDWLSQARADRVALWTTWHPTQQTLDRFLSQCARLDALGIRYSVGVVGLHDHLDAIDTLRARLRPDVYLWINAFKRVADYYDPATLARLERVDPLFALNTVRHPSAGKACWAGETSFTVDGQGDVRRCHFVGDVIDNIYAADFPRGLRPRACPNATCGCHIGYVHLKPLDLYTTYGPGLLERVPAPYFEPTMRSSDAPL
jgi:MoaA/NifB/PqqE/SkfB family radical SAM enzyme